jgi:hypothetical protein
VKRISPTEGGNPFDTGEITVGADGIRRYGIAHFPRGDAGYARCRPSDGRGHRRRLSYQWDPIAAAELAETIATDVKTW